jgi:glycosyltransferase involved in cell wall biosynthesis
MLLMRICHIVTSLEMGGMERVVCDLLASSAGYLFCTDSEGQLFAGAQAQSKECGGRRARKMVVDWGVVWKLFRFIRTHKIECLHAHNHVAHLYAVLASVLTCTPVVVTLHGQGYYDTPRTLKLRRWLSRLTKAVVVVSKDAGEVVVKSGAVPPGEIRVIPNGVDTFRFSPASFRREGVSPVCIGSIGRLAPEKNYPLLIRAFAQLVGGRACCAPRTAPRRPSQEYDADASLISPEQPNNLSQITNNSLYLLLVGDGSERGHIESVIRELGLTERCTLTGMQSNVLTWLHQMDVFCLPSDTEGLSMTLLEACACGLPCVVTDVGGNAEIVKDGVSGYVVPKGDVIVMAAALERLIADMKLREEMGQAARKNVKEKFSLAAMVAGYEAVYAEAGGLAQIIGSRPELRQG